MEDDKNTELFNFKTCANVPMPGGRRYDGGLVEVEGRVLWGGWERGLYVLDEVNLQWERVADASSQGAILAVCGGRLVSVGGLKGGVWSKKVMELRGGRWFFMSNMLVGCCWSCVVSVSGGGIVVMGGRGDGWRYLNDVQVFDGKTQTWHIGPALPQPCCYVSAVVHGDLVFVMGGQHMNKAVWCADIHELTTAHTHDTEQSIWRKLPNVPYYYSSVCVVDGVLLAIGGADACVSKKTSGIYAFHHVNQKWKHVGDLPFKCSYVDTLLLSGGELMVVDGWIKRVFKIVVKGLTKLIPPHPTKTDKRRLYKEAMSKGYVETSITKCLILGAAGVGKTHLTHLLLNKDPPQQHVSTGLADNPVQAIKFSQTVVSREEDNWFVVDYDQALMKVVGSTIGGSEVSMATPLDEVVQTLPKMSINVSSHGDGALHPDSLPADVSITMDTAQQSSTVVSIEEEVIHHINQSTCKNEKLFGVEWIHFIDSGGLLQYHDILPLFIQNPVVIMFVLNLSEELSQYPSIEYYGSDGKPVSKAYQSPLSHQQIVEHCLGAIHSQNGQPLVIFVGTHRDAAGSCTESIEEKNQKLNTLFKASDFNVLYNREKLIFAVNGKIPETVDRHVAKELKKKIVSTFSESIKMPIAWLRLEVVLQRSSHDGILSLVECEECAKRLHIEGDAFSAALHHLVQHNVFLYYPEVLPQTVFCNPQVVLSKVTELVEYHYKLCYNPKEGVAARHDIVVFRDHGIVSMEVLKKYPKYYKEGLFSAQDLLQVLLSVRAIVEMREGDYLMPALLPHLDCEKLSKYTEQDNYMIMKPSKGCIGSGVFCCLVAYLLSPSNRCCWKVCMDGDKPLCLYRNCITFEVEDCREIVTLVEQFSYIVIHVDKMSSRVCKEIRGCIHSGIKSVCSLLKYQDIQFKDAFMCRGASCRSDPPHVAVVVCKKRWKCSIQDCKYGDLSKDQLMWFGEETLCTFAITGKEEKFEWAEFGVTINVPSGCLPSTIQSRELTITTDLNTDITIPSNSSLVSAVYEINLNPPVQDLNAPVDLVMEHCVDLKPGQENCLSFVVAKGETPTTFERLPGGVFSVDKAGRNIGKISVRSFSWFGIVIWPYNATIAWLWPQQEHPTIKYTGRVYYEDKTDHRIVQFLVTKNLKCMHKEVTRQFSKKEEFNVPVEFDQPEIVLEMPSNTDGWELKPNFSPCQVTKNVVDSFEEGQTIPGCSFTARWTRITPALTCSKDINIRGAKSLQRINVLCSLGATAPTVTVPTATVPTATVPTATVPTATVPTATAPTATVPTATAPTVTVPTATVPTATVPTATVPTATVPTATVPTATVPTATAPTVTVPTATVPTATLPTATVPTATVPTATVPTATASSLRPSLVITNQPQSLKVPYGSEARLSCTAEGLPDQVITYEWYKGGAKIDSGTSGDHVITGATCEDEGQYLCVVSCGGSKVESNRVNLEVKLAPTSLDSEPSLPQLMNKVAAVIPNKYWTVGIQLGLTQAELEAIRPQHQSLEKHKQAFGEIFDIWRRRGSPPYTWRTIIDALKSASVDEVALSEQLISWITNQLSLSPPPPTTPSPPNPREVPYVVIGGQEENTKLFNFKTCANVPEGCGQRCGGGGLVEVEGRVMWGDRKQGVYVLDDVNSQWKRVADGVEYGAKLAVCGGRLISVGGYKDGVYSKKVMELRGERWSYMSDMLVECVRSCTVSVSGGDVVVMGGWGDGLRPLNDVQVFDGTTQTWHRGPSLLQPCGAMSAVVHGNLVFVMGGYPMGRVVWCADIHELTTAHTHDTEQSIWRKLPDVPYYKSSVCVVDGVLLAIGGTQKRNGSKKTSRIYAFHHVNQEWKHVGDLPFECSLADTLLLSGGELMVVDGTSQQVLKIIVKGLTKLITPHPTKTDERWSQQSS